MRHSRMFRSSFERMVFLFMAVAAYTASSCTDDTFDKYGQQATSGILTFDVAVPGSWTNGSAVTKATDKAISIQKITQCDGEKPLYLVTEIAEAAVDTAAHHVMTRGTTTTGETFKNHSFGLSAICYTGNWPEKEEENKWTTNFAHNIEVSHTQGTWKPTKTLHWTGSGNIKFFAYSPYSATVQTSTEDDAENDTPSIIHSAANATGVPTLTYTVPTEVTKQTDLMYATATCSGNGTGDDVSNGTINLKFRHSLTAVTIKTGKKMLAGTVTDITISGVHGSGTYRIGAENWETTDEATRTFSINNSTALNKKEDELMTDAGTVLNKDKDGFTFMMIPQELTESATLTISFTDEFTSIQRSLTARLKDFTKDGKWLVGKKYTYSINSTGIVISPVIDLKVNRENTMYPNGGQKGIDVITLKENALYTPMSAEEKLAYLPVSGLLNNVSIAAYTRVVQAGAETEEAKEQIKKLNFKIEWSVDGGQTWESPSAGSQTGWRPETTSQNMANNTDLTSHVNGSILLPAQKQFTYMQDFLRGKQPSIEGQILNATITDEGKGSKTAPYDLVANNEVAQESANCYIVNDHGYYEFPAYYGNTYHNNSTSSYQYDGNIDDIPESTRGFILTKFVGHDDRPISQGLIANAADAILLWQDSPDLVTDVTYNSSNNKISFRVPKETINQGNAVIAVRNDQKKILWSWHIWVTHRKWDVSSCIQMNSQNEYDRPFIIAPCNLGYCEPHGEDDEREILIRFVVDNKLAGEDGVILNEQITVEGAAKKTSEAKSKGIIKFIQPKIAASVAGDNTYYQWGRKDAMLPGIHNEDTYANGLPENSSPSVIPPSSELDMVNKMFYSTEEIRFTSTESGKSIGKSIQSPASFFMYQRLEGGTASDSYKRRHWHDGTNAPYQLKTIMNYWNTQLTESGNADYFDYKKKDDPDYKKAPNNKYVVKTIYDPSPAGFKIPPIKAFSDLFDSVELSEADKKKNNTVGKPNATEVSTPFKGWTVSINNHTFYFPATGVRNMGIPNKGVKYGTFPAFSSITYIATSGFHKNEDSSSCLIFSIDKRTTAYFPNCTAPIAGTNNAYGFTVRPIRDGQTKE
ncbi:fimbrillin family protein [uncultured Bacteroides sp.]|uniref:fimbrillin family protein n=2 Tax=uncultured Bacteroides sp. TaxID=162156 RepID=UPI0026294A4B|nr:fimbrillin family protein [uncultured Bacteroides sp.]